MPSMGERFGFRARVPLLLLVASLDASGCSTDTAGLERRAPDGASGGGASDQPAASAGAGVGAGGAGESGAASIGMEPEVGALDIVHGLVDGGNLFVCLWDVATGHVIGADLPEPSGGVLYGQSQRVPTVWDLSNAVDVELFVAAGTAASGLSCSGLRESAVDGEAVTRSVVDAGASDAGIEPPPFPLEPLEPRRAGSLRLSSGLVQAGAHYALVAAGCTSPAGSPSEDICGRPDSLFASQQTIVLAEIASEVVGGAGVGLQFLNASRAVTRADLVLQGQSQRQSLRLSSDVQFGAVRPRNAAPVDIPVGVELHVQGATQSSYTQPWSETIAAGGGDTLTAGENYLLVYVGPAPGTLAEGVAPPRFVLLRGH
jgi:hypothetical protein